MKILFVCKGNICRSPLAEIVFKTLANRQGIEKVECASAGTHDYHIGKPADARAIRVAEQNGYDLSKHKVQKIQANHFRMYDYIFAMDRATMKILEQIALPDMKCQLGFFLRSGDGEHVDVRDPFYLEEKDFEEVLTVIEANTKILMQEFLDRGISGRESNIPFK